MALVQDDNVGRLTADTDNGGRVHEVKTVNSDSTNTDDNSGRLNGGRLTANTDNGGCLTAKVDLSKNKPVIKQQTGVCALESCQQSFIKTVYNKKFCSDDCRIANWEITHGKTFKKGKPKTK